MIHIRNRYFKHEILESILKMSVQIMGSQFGVQGGEQLLHSSLETSLSIWDWSVEVCIERDLEG